MMMMMMIMMMMMELVGGGVVGGRGGIRCIMGDVQAVNKRFTERR